VGVHDLGSEISAVPRPGEHHQGVRVPAVGTESGEVWLRGFTEARDAVTGKAERELCVLFDARPARGLAELLRKIAHADRVEQAQREKATFQRWCREKGYDDPAALIDEGVFEGAVYVNGVRPSDDPESVTA